MTFYHTEGHLLRLIRHMRNGKLYRIFLYLNTLYKIKIHAKFAHLTPSPDFYPILKAQKRAGFSYFAPCLRRRSAPSTAFDRQEQQAQHIWQTA